MKTALRPWWVRVLGLGWMADAASANTFLLMHANYVRKHCSNLVASIPASFSTFACSFTNITSSSLILEHQVFSCRRINKYINKQHSNYVAQWFVWLSGLVVSALGIRARGPGFESRFVRANIPLGSNLVQVVYTHCLPSFSAPRNLGTKKEFSAPKWLWWLSALD